MHLQSLALNELADDFNKYSYNGREDGKATIAGISSGRLL
jgi:hypothetical protein